MYISKVEEVEVLPGNKVLDAKDCNNELGTVRPSGHLLVTKALALRP